MRPMLTSFEIERSLYLQQRKEKPEGWTRREKSEATRFGNRVVLLS